MRVLRELSTRSKNYGYTRFYTNSIAYGGCIIGKRAWFDDNRIAHKKRGASFRAIKKNGKFHGKNACGDTNGSLNKKMFSLGRSLWMISHSYRLTHSAI